MHFRRTPACLLSVDVEDWFHILDFDSAPSLNTWSSLPSRVEYNFHRILALLSDTGTIATMFFLVWVAERFHQLVVGARARGHEIASHSYSHRLVYTMTPKELVEDTHRARSILEDISGDPVRGYRAPGFSVTAQTPWSFECLAEAGHTHDCPVFPAARGHGGVEALVKVREGNVAVLPNSAAEGNYNSFPTRSDVSEFLSTGNCLFWALAEWGLERDR